MKSFDSFKEEGKVKEKTPNPEQAKSLIEKAEKRLNYVKDREITEENADLILEDSYEAIREAIDAFLTLDGYKSYNHEASIVYAYENLEIDYNTANKLNKYRKLRNDSKYRGEDITKKEATDTRNKSEELIPKLKKEFQQRNQK